MTDDPLAGHWIKESDTACSSGYPDELELQPGGRYVGRMRPGAREHPDWDDGTYERLDDGRLTLTTATDALGHYAFALEGERLTVTDEAGCSFSYRRRREPPGSSP